MWLIIFLQKLEEKVVYNLHLNEMNRWFFFKCWSHLGVYLLFIELRGSECTPFEVMFITIDPADGRNNLVKFSKTPVPSLLKHLLSVSGEQTFTHLKAVGNTWNVDKISILFKHKRCRDPFWNHERCSWGQSLSCQYSSAKIFPRRIDIENICGYLNHHWKSTRFFLILLNSFC